MVSLLMARISFAKRNRTPESAFRSACIKWMKMRFGRHLFHQRNAAGPYSRPGLPDDVFSIYGIAVWIEFKDPSGNGRIGTRQQEVIDEIRAAGGRAYVVASWDELEACLAEFLPVQLGMEMKRR